MQYIYENAPYTGNDKCQVTVIFLRSKLYSLANVAFNIHGLWRQDIIHITDMVSE